MAASAPVDIGRRAPFNTLIVLAARVFSRMVALVVVLLLARHLGDEGYGRFATVSAFSALVSVLADFGFNSLYTREAARCPEQAGEFLSLLSLAKVGLAALAGLVLGLLLDWQSLGGLALPAAALLAATTYAQLVRNTFFALGRAIFEAVAILVEIVVLADLVLYGAATHRGVAFFIWAYAAASVAVIAYSLVVIHLENMARLTLRIRPRELTAWFTLAFPFALGSFLTNLYFRMDVPILKLFRPFAEVGWYNLGYKPFEALQFVPLALQAVVYPVLAVYFRRDPERLLQGYRRFFKALVILGWPLSVGTFVLVHPIGRVFGLFPESEPALRILAWGVVFLFVNSAFTAVLYATDRQRFFPWATGIAVVVNLGLNLALIPRYGYLAASATTVATEAAFSVAAWYFIRGAGPVVALPLVRLAWRPVLAGVLMGAELEAVLGFSPVGSMRALPLLAICVPAGAAAYVAGLVVSGAVTAGEWRALWAGLRGRGSGGAG